MNHDFFVTVVAWQTRNWRHQKKAVERCRDYGLSLFLSSMYVGTLTHRERNRLTEECGNLFSKPTEKFFVLVMCKSCQDLAEPENLFKKPTLHERGFEIVG